MISVFKECCKSDVPLGMFKVTKTKSCIIDNSLDNSTHFYIYKSIDTSIIENMLMSSICDYRRTKHFIQADGYNGCKYKVYLKVFESKRQILEQISLSKYQSGYTRKAHYYTDLYMDRYKRTISINPFKKYMNVFNLYECFISIETKIKGEQMNIFYLLGENDNFYTEDTNDEIVLPALKEYINKKPHQFKTLSQLKAAHQYAESNPKQVPPISLYPYKPRSIKVPYHCIKVFNLALVAEVFLKFGLSDLVRIVYYHLYSKYIKDRLNAYKVK